MALAPSRLGGFLIAAGFAVYLAIAVGSWHQETDLSLVTIVGTLLVGAGAKRILTAKAAPKAITYLTFGSLVAGFILGRIAAGMPVESMDDVRNFTMVYVGQGLGFTLAGITPLVYRSSVMVRGLAGLAIAGNVAAGIYVFTRFQDWVAGAATSDDLIAAGTFGSVLDNLALLAALVFAFQQPATEPVPAMAGNPAAPTIPPATSSGPDGRPPLGPMR